MSPANQAESREGSQMRPIERDILLADSGELPVVHRAMLRLRLLGDPEARRYVRAIRMMRAGVGAVQPRRSPLLRLAFASLAAAAAVALTVTLWPRSAPTAGSSPAVQVVTKSGDVLETPLITQARLLAIQAERPASSPPAREIYVASLPAEMLATLPTSTAPPLWSSLPLAGTRGSLKE